MYPSTTSFYPAIVVENTMFERNTLVVQFDDEGAFELLHPNDYHYFQTDTQKRR